jgi:hypothetical protein
MADVNKEIALKVTTDVNQTTQQFKSATEELKKTQKSLVEMALAGKQGTKEFREMETRAGQLRDAIGDVRQRVNALASDTPKLDLLTGAAQGIAGGFAAAQGAAALFGSENEEVQQAILKTQGAMALLNGVQQVANTLNKDSAFMTQANAMAQRAYGVAVGASTGALKLFRLALIATGIGAAVVAVGLLVANFEKLKSAVMGFIETSKPLQAIVTFITEGFTKLGRAIGIIPSESVKATRQMIDDLEKQKKLLEAAGADTAAISRRILELRLQVAKETKDGIAEIEEEITLFEAKEGKKRADADKAAKEKRLAEEKKQLEEIKKLREQAAADQKAIDQIAIDAQNALIQRALDATKELQQINEQRRRAALTARQREREDIIADSERKIALLRELGASELEIIMEQNRLRGILAKQIADEEVRIAKEAGLKMQQDRAIVFDAIVQTTRAGLQGIADLSAFFAGQDEQRQRKAFEIQKKANIAITLIDSILSAQKAYKSLAEIPVVGTVLGAVAAASALAAGLARVAAIRNTTFGAATTSAAPQAVRQAGVQGNAPLAFNPNQSTPINPMQNNTNSTGQQGAQRVYVLERDISSVGRRVKNVENFATFGN